jgi:hypothetical protein
VDEETTGIALGMLCKSVTKEMGGLYVASLSSACSEAKITCFQGNMFQPGKLYNVTIKPHDP